jgi:hypothetical protein
MATSYLAAQGRNKDVQRVGQPSEVRKVQPPRFPGSEKTFKRPHPVKIAESYLAAQEMHEGVQRGGQRSKVRKIQPPASGRDGSTIEDVKI